MFFLLFSFALKVFASVSKLLEAGEELLYKVKLTQEDHQLFVQITNLSKNKNLSCIFLTPEASNDKRKKLEDIDSYFSEMSDGESEIVETVVKKVFYEPGLYVLKLFNTGDQMVEFSLFSSASPKINTSNKDVVDLRNFLNKLRGMMEDLVNENLFLTNYLTKSVDEARFILRSTTFLLIFPLLTLLVAYGKYILARQLVKPKGKRFKGLF